VTCPNCRKPTDSIRTVIRSSEVMSGCSRCLRPGSKHGQNDIAKYNRDRQREDYRQDIVQPFEPRDYIKARGIQGAMEKGYSEEDIRKYG
jgi:predicted amidophosphoribosyltransferase